MFVYALTEIRSCYVFIYRSRYGPSLGRHGGVSYVRIIGSNIRILPG